MFTGGEDLVSMEKLMIKLNKEGQSVILNFADEPCEGFVPNDEYFDMNCDILMKSIKAAARCNPENTISLKMTGLIGHDLLVKTNKA